MAGKVGVNTNIFISDSLLIKFFIDYSGDFGI